MVASRDKAKAETYAKEQELSKGVTYEELYATEMDNFDACYVPISTAHRGPVLEKMANAGKHIYSEKPLGGQA